MTNSDNFSEMHKKQLDDLLKRVPKLSQQQLEISKMKKNTLNKSATLSAGKLNYESMSRQLGRSSFNANVAMKQTEELLKRHTPIGGVSAKDAAMAAGRFGRPFFWGYRTHSVMGNGNNPMLVGESYLDLMNRNAKLVDLLGTRGETPFQARKRFQKQLPYMARFNNATANELRFSAQAIAKNNLPQSIKVNTLINGFGLGSVPKNGAQIESMVNALSILNKNKYDQVIETAVHETIPDEQENSQEDLDLVEIIVQKSQDSKDFFIDWYQSLNPKKQYAIKAVLDYAVSNLIATILHIGGYTLLIALLLPILFSKTSEHDPDNPDNTVVKD